MGISLREGQAVRTGSGQAWAFTSNSERGQDLPKVTYHTSANPGLDPWILTPPPPAEVLGPPGRPDTPPKRAAAYPLSALLPFILTWNSPRWTSRAPSMSHMSCKTPHRAAQRCPPRLGHRGHTQTLPGRGPWTERCFLRVQGNPPKLGPGPRCPPMPPQPAHLSALLQAAAQLLQALPGGAAGWALGEGPLHVGGTITQAALDAVALVEFVHLPGTQEGGCCPR